jgi:hypothetical protein
MPVSSSHRTTASIISAETVALSELAASGRLSMRCATFIGYCEHYD